jgi:glycine hydroxymethyltransferase
VVTAAVTTRGFKESDMKLVAQYIDEAINSQEKPEILEEIHKKVIELTSRFPLPYHSI